MFCSPDEYGLFYPTLNVDVWWTWFILSYLECWCVMSMVYFILPWMLMCDEHGLFYPTLNAPVMVGAATTTLPLRGKGQGNYTDLGPDIIDLLK